MNSKIDFSDLENQLIDLSREVDDEELALEEVFAEVANLLKNSERYELLEKIDTGGVKNIYKMLDKHTGRELAMAELKVDESSALDRAKVINEARLTARLEHPNIVPIHDISCSPSDEPFFTMKLLKGENLADILAKLSQGDSQYKKSYPLFRLLDIFSKICYAVEYAHTQNVLHLDLKPENIHIGEFGEVFVVDWGLAAELKDGKEEHAFEQLNKMLKLSETTLCGTPGYMAPEQISAGRTELRASSDIYALGAILYSMLTLKRPCLATESAEIIKETLLPAFVSPLERCPKLPIPLALNAVVCKAMAKDKQQRYPSVHSLIKEIQAFLAGYATEAEQANLLQNLYLLYKRNRGRFQLAGFFLLLIIVLSSLFIIQLQDSEQQARAHEQEAREHEKEAVGNLKRFESAREERQQVRREKNKLLRESAPIILNGQHLYQVDLQYETARKLLHTFLELTPEDPKGNMELARLYMSELRFEEAIKHFEKSKEFGYPFLERENELLEASKRLHADFKLEKANMAKKTQRLIDYVPYEHIIAYASLRFNTGEITGFNKLRFVNKALAKMNDLELNDSLKVLADGTYAADFSHTKIKRLSPFTGFPLSEMNLNSSQVLHIRYLRRCPLRKLDISNTLVNDLTPLYNIGLQQLRMKNLFVIADFRKLSTLTHLDMEGSQLNKKHFLSKMPKLKELNIAFSNINDFQAINKLKKLEALTLSPKTFTQGQINQLRSRNIEVKVLEPSHE
ncbi:serine/threonine protein kinase [Lentisphaera araneosa HTCC2155]|uniref:Serine/threonine protein kinase n=1 Tax=Lentisphaera araneosa HTCC2155 TaxID=313628 RepID=A6DHX9_9BACT|nr:serine/threonine-protein kinase [Lentisphaera araneosa]EDM28633.1 serine/threonine protein kinase [Lentisphaera araneosa HTCC2155]